MVGNNNNKGNTGNRELGSFLSLSLYLHPCLEWSRILRTQVFLSRFSSLASNNGGSTCKKLSRIWLFFTWNIKLGLKKHLDLFTHDNRFKLANNGIIVVILGLKETLVKKSV